jgi:restriction endonuclease
MTKGFKSCFILAPLGAPIKVLQEALSARGIRWTDATSLSVVGAPFKDQIRSAIASADFLCAFMPHGSVPKNLAFELGIGVGLGRPLLIFAEPGAESPFGLDDSVYIRTALMDRKVVNAHLDAFLRHARRARSRPKFTLPSRRRVIDRVTALRDLNSTLRSGRAGGREFEKFVADLFKRAGYTVSASRGADDAGADMALWIDELQASVGNPLLVELKYGRLSRGILRGVEQQLASYVTGTHGKAGILIYCDVRGKEFPSLPSGPPMVIRMSARELIEAVGRDHLAKDIADWRNRIAHQSG